jgi:carbon catabolite-derepressing protein kinase
LITLQPRNTLSPNALSPQGDLEENLFEAAFNAEYEDGEEEDDDIDDGLDFSTPPINSEFGDHDLNTFAVLNSSLPLPDQLPEQHHLASYANAKRAWPVKEKKQHRTKWHFGIRSRSPPMEVMLEIYRTLKALGMEWKEKRNLGGLGGVKSRPRSSMDGGAKIERAREMDGSDSVDLRVAASVYFVETRARVQDVVVRTPLFPATDYVADVLPGPHESPALHGRLDKLPRRLPPQKDLQSFRRTRRWKI